MSRNKYIYFSIIIWISSLILINFLIKKFRKPDIFKFSNFNELANLISNKDIINSFSNNGNKSLFLLNLSINNIFLINSKILQANQNNNNFVKILIFKNSILDINKININNHIYKFDKKNWKIYINENTYINNNLEYFYCKFQGVIDLSSNKKYLNKLTSNINIKFKLTSKTKKCNYNINSNLNFPNYVSNSEKQIFIYSNLVIILFNIAGFIYFYKIIKEDIKNGKFYSNLFFVILSTFFIIDSFNNLNLYTNFQEKNYIIIFISLSQFLIYCFIVLKVLNFFIYYNIKKLREQGYNFIQIKQKLLLYYIKNYFIYIFIIYFGFLYYGKKLYFIFYFSIFFLQNLHLWKINKYFVSEQKLVFIIYLSKFYNWIYFNANENNYFLKVKDLNCFMICLVLILLQYLLLSLQLIIGGNFIKGIYNKNKGLGKYFHNKSNIEVDTLKTECSICYDQLKDDNVEYDKDVTKSKLLSAICKNKNEFIFKTDCNHLFHVSCIMIHLTYKNNCPICRTEINDIPM